MEGVSGRCRYDGSERFGHLLWGFCTLILDKVTPFVKMGRAVGHDRNYERMVANGWVESLRSSRPNRPRYRIERKNWNSYTEVINTVSFKFISIGGCSIGAVYKEIKLISYGSESSKSNLRATERIRVRDKA